MEGIIKFINFSLYLGSLETQSKALGSKFYLNVAYFRFEFVDLFLLSFPLSLESLSCHYTDRTRCKHLRYLFTYFFTFSIIDAFVCYPC